MKTLVVENLQKTYVSAKSSTEAIRNLTFEVDDGEFLAIVGPSGCGKTTLLKCLSGLLAPTSGSAVLDGEPIKEPPEKLALVFQEYTRSLMPWLTVKSNVILPLKSRRTPRAERERIAQQALKAVELDAFADHHPWQLSGGMQQRVAIARAIAYQPRILLMDEPFASVDAQTRIDLEDLLLEVQKEFGITVVFVTHDIEEAIYLADRVAVLSARPTHIREIVEIDLPKPRDQVATKSSQRYADLRTYVTEMIHSS
ncbi:MAG: ABC transporter [Micrococcales bacterium 73-13]|nr:MAG: ABC transporter [Micrococcales bacterium 73-13]